MFESWLKPFPDPIEDRLSPELKCRYYFDKFALCRGGKSQMNTMYEHGGYRSCREDWEEFRWCVKAKLLRDEMSTKRLAVRKRNVYTTMDQMPWVFKREYLEYLRDEQRLPKRYLYLVDDDAIDDDAVDDDDDDNVIDESIVAMHHDNNRRLQESSLSPLKPLSIMGDTTMTTMLSPVVVSQTMTLEEPTTSSSLSPATTTTVAAAAASTTTTTETVNRDEKRQFRLEWLMGYRS